MEKKWQEMTQSEKIDALRKDVKAIFHHLNDLSAAQHTMSRRLDSAASLAFEVSKKVDALTKRLQSRKGAAA
jgi:hypothetical protein